MEAAARMGGPPAFVERVREKDAEALALYRKCVENFGCRVALVATMMDPEAIFLFTDFADLGDGFLEEVWEEAKKHTTPVSLEGLELAFGGRRTDEERLAAAAVPILSRIFVEGVLDVPAHRGVAPAAAE